MEFPPLEWDLFNAEDFELAVPRSPGELGVELLALVRPNGRIMDHWRLTIGGSEILEAELHLRELIPTAANLPSVTAVYQLFLAAIDIRRNMTASPWLDLVDLLRANDIVLKEGSEVTTADVVETLSNLPDKNFASASLRWAVCASDSGRLELQLQSLAATSKYLSGRPTFKRYNRLGFLSFPQPNNCLAELL